MPATRNTIASCVSLAIVRPRKVETPMRSAAAATGFCRSVSAPAMPVANTVSITSAGAAPPTALHTSAATAPATRIPVPTDPEPRGASRRPAIASARTAIVPARTNGHSLGSEFMGRVVANPTPNSGSAHQPHAADGGWATTRRLARNPPPTSATASS